MKSTTTEYEYDWDRNWIGVGVALVLILIAVLMMVSWLSPTTFSERLFTAIVGVASFILLSFSKNRIRKKTVTEQEV